MLPYCNCTDFEETTTLRAIQYHDTVIVVKNVPCKCCTNCGDIYFDNSVVEKLDAIIAQAKKQVDIFPQEVTVIDFFKVI